MKGLANIRGHGVWPWIQGMRRRYACGARAGN